MDPADPTRSPPRPANPWAQLSPQLSESPLTPKVRGPWTDIPQKKLPPPLSTPLWSVRRPEFGERRLSTIVGRRGAFLTYPVFEQGHDPDIEDPYPRQIPILSFDDDDEAPSFPQVIKFPTVPVFVSTNTSSTQTVEELESALRTICTSLNEEEVQACLTLHRYCEEEKNRARELEEFRKSRELELKQQEKLDRIEAEALKAKLKVAPRKRLKSNSKEELAAYKKKILTPRVEKAGCKDKVITSKVENSKKKMSGTGVAPQAQAAGGGSNPAAPQLFKGIVKQVLSGDSIIIRGQPKGGPPPERQLNFSNITAPRLARRPGGPGAKPDDGKDEPWAWEAREHIRKKLVGKEVVFVVDYKVPASGREYGTVFLGKDTETGENISEEIVRLGLATVRKEGKADVARLVELEEKAKAESVGKWGEENEKHIRDVVWQVENPRQLLDKFGRKPVLAVVEHVRDGSTIRAFLLPSFHYVTLMMSGIRCPGVKLDAEGKPDLASREPFSEEAKFFTESRLLQRDVEIILESVNNQNLVGSIIHPNGNIAELLLKDGFARCIDWSMGFVTGGAEKLRGAEKSAKEKKLRIWKDYQVSASTNPAAGLKAKDKEFVATVIECVNGDALMVRLADGTVKKIFLASIRPPRLAESGEGETKDKKMRPLYDIPFMFEAREYLRKKLMTKKVNVTVDYIQPASQSFPEKNCCTVKIDGANVAEGLVSKGFVTVVRYRQDDDQRASEYDALLAAEAKAQKALKGLHGKDVPVHHVVDLSGDAAKAKQFLPYLQRAGKITALVEYVASGSRLRLFVPRETRLITFLLAGISCPRAGRSAGQGGPVMDGEPFGEEALAFTKDMCHQREVEIEVDSIDKAGNFIGFLWLDNKNLSVQLVEEGLSTVHFSAERTPYFRPLQIAEDNAKARREKIWRDFVDAKEEIKPEDDKVERKVDPKPVLVTEVTSELRVFVQFTDDGDKLEALMNDVRRELAEKPPLTGAYTPKKGDLCVARYSGDGEWYRARVEKMLPDGEVAVIFFDYGNRENVKAAKCAALPAIAASSLPPFAKEYALACVSLATDEDFASEAVHAVRHDTADGIFLLNVEYKVGGLEYVTLADKTSKEDLAQKLIKEGLLLVENKKERRLQKLLKDYKAAETEAKTKHLCIWQYGDITEDDAREFGMGGGR